MACWVSVIVKLCEVPEEGDVHKKRSHEKVSMGKAIEGSTNHDTIVIKNLFWPLVEKDDLALER